MAGTLLGIDSTVSLTEILLLSLKTGTLCLKSPISETAVTGRLWAEGNIDCCSGQEIKNIPQMMI